MTKEEHIRECEEYESVIRSSDNPSPDGAIAVSGLRIAIKALAYAHGVIYVGYGKTQPVEDFEPDNLDDIIDKCIAKYKTKW